MDLTTQIFLIFDNPTDWESYPQVIGYTKTEEDAKSYLANETKNYIEATELIAKLEDKRVAFIKTLPIVNFEERLVRPRWQAGISEKNITLEMRKERNDIYVENLLIDDRNRIKMMERTNLVYDHLIKYYEFLSISDDVRKYITLSPSYGSISINQYLKVSKPFYYQPTEQII